MPIIGYDYKKVYEEEQLYNQAEVWVGNYCRQIIKKINIAVQSKNEELIKEYEKSLYIAKKELRKYPMDVELLRKIITEYPKKIKDFTDKE